MGSLQHCQPGAEQLGIQQTRLVVVETLHQVRGGYIKIEQKVEKENVALSVWISE